MKLISYDPGDGKDKLAISSLPPYGVLFTENDGAMSDMMGRIARFYENLHKSQEVGLNILHIIFSRRGRTVESFKERMMISLHRGDITCLEYRRLRMKPLSFMDIVKRDIKRNKTESCQSR